MLRLSLRAALTAALSTFAAGLLSAQTPTSHPGLTFSGTGIPNDQVVTNDSSSIGVLLGLTATARCYNPGSGQVCGPAVTNDGVETFFAQPGDGQVNGTGFDAQWNFDFAAVGDNFGLYSYTVFYDTDPAVGNGTTGSFSIPLCITGFPFCFINAQDSENLRFFDSTFDPTVNGQYEFDLVAYNVDGLQSSSTQMFVDVGNVGAVVPEPATMSLLAMGLVGLAGVKRRKRSK